MENELTPMQKMSIIEQSNEIQTAVKLMMALYLEIGANQHLKFTYDIEGDCYDVIFCKEGYFVNNNIENKAQKILECISFDLKHHQRLSDESIKMINEYQTPTNGK